MKNRFTFILSVAAISLTILGCGSFGPSGGSKESSNASTPNEEKAAGDKVVDTTVGESKIGVPECDEVMVLIEAEMNNPEDDYITKAVKATFLNRIKDGIRDSVEKNKQDTTEMAKTCREFKKQFDKYKAEDNAKKGQ